MMEPSHVETYTVADIERLADKTLRASFPRGIDPPIDIDLIAEKQPLIDEFGLLAEINSKFGVDAVIRSKRNERFDIIIDSNVCWGRASFSIAHEIGHIVLHPKLYSGCYTIKDSIELSRRIKRSYARIERDANYFAGAILIPRKTIFDDVEKIYKGILQSYAKDIKWDRIIPMLHSALANRYRVSVQTMEIRLNQLRINQKLYESVNAHSDFIVWI